MMKRLKVGLNETDERHCKMHLRRSHNQSITAVVRKIEACHIIICATIFPRTFNKINHTVGCIILRSMNINM